MEQLPDGQHKGAEFDGVASNSRWRSPVVALFASCLLHLLVFTALYPGGNLLPEMPQSNAREIHLRIDGGQSDSVPDQPAPANSTPASSSPETHAPQPEQMSEADARAPESGPIQLGTKPSPVAAPVRAIPVSAPSQDLKELLLTRADRPHIVPAPPAQTPPRPELRLPATVGETDSIRERLESSPDFLSRLITSGEAVAWREGEVHYRAEARRLAATSSSDLDRAVIKITRQLSGRRWSTDLQFKRLAFSHFAQMVNRWDPDVAISEDRIDGRFHVNSAINIDPGRGASPQFTGKVTVVGGIRYSGFVRKDKIFLGGVETRAPPLELPRELMPLGDWAVEAEQVHRVAVDTAIEFYPDGSYAWRPEGGKRARGRVPAAGLYLMAEEGARISVAGRVKGQVVVYAPERITITGDLLYASDPRQHPESEDFLGLISGGYVEVAPPDVTGPGDLNLQAAIFAGRRFSVRRFDRHNNGTLRIYGSVSAGSLSATEPRYATDLVFDPRLESVRPPGFPVTDRYEMERWDGLWTRVD